MNLGFLYLYPGDEMLSVLGVFKIPLVSLKLIIYKLHCYEIVSIPFFDLRTRLFFEDGCLLGCSTI
jgi:hypothetical protein